MDAAVETLTVENMMDKQAESLRAIADGLDALFAQHDGRLVAASLALRASRTYSTLKSIGLETELSIAKLYKELLRVAQAAPETKDKVVYESGAPAGVQ